MKKLPVASLLLLAAGTIFGQDLRIVNAASLSQVSVSPGSIITIFGSQLAAGVAFASDVQTPPTTLGGVTVTIGGAPASIFYVSPKQINAVVNPSTPLGTDPVNVVSSIGTHTGTLAVASNAPPGLFSLFGTGTRDGAILNAITFLLGDFSTRTANSPTYLALFATGLNTGTTPTVTVGGVPVQVAFFGPAPCCDGLQQINLLLPDSLAGAGRVPVVLMSNGVASNAVQVVLLPPANARQFSDDQDNQTRSRELASLAYVPGTSLVLSVDENDDVVRVIDVSSRKVTRVITLPKGANPDGIAVNTAGTIAAVAESGTGKLAILNLTLFTVNAEAAVGAGATRVAIGGTQAAVVNQDADNVSIVDLTGSTVQKTLSVGRGPAGVAVDSVAHLAYVTNEDDGTISVIDLVGLTVLRTITLGAATRPESIALVPGTTTAFVAVPSANADGHVLLVNLATGTVTSTLAANPDHSGGTSDIVFFNSNIYFANQTGSSVSVLPVNSSGAVAGKIATVGVDLGARALAIDTKDNLLVVSNEGTGTLVLVNLATNSVVGRIQAVQTNSEGDGGNDDHSDRDSAPNAPAIQGISPSSGKAGTTFTMTITGVNLTGASKVIFINPSSLPGNGKGHGKGVEENNSDSAFVVTNIQVSAGGSKLTCSVATSSAATAGPRLVKVEAPNGDSSGQISTANTFTVNQ